VSTESDVSSEDRVILERQLGRLRYQPQRVTARCHRGYPGGVVAFHTLDLPPHEVTSNSLDWVTCPWLERRIQSLENEKWLEHLRWFLDQEAGEPLRQSLLAASKRYTERARELFEIQEPGLFERRYQDSTFGIGGTRRPFGLKCLHNHVATFLAEEPTPLGEFALALVELDLQGGPEGPLDCRGDCMETPAEFGLDPWEV
jgi:hypothetical protein